MGGDRSRLPPTRARGCVATDRECFCLLQLRGGGVATGCASPRGIAFIPPMPATSPASFGCARRSPAASAMADADLSPNVSPSITFAFRGAGRAHRLATLRQHEAKARRGCGVSASDILPLNPARGSGPPGAAMCGRPRRMRPIAHRLNLAWARRRCARSRTRAVVAHPAEGAPALANHPPRGDAAPQPNNGKVH